MRISFRGEMTYASEESRKNMVSNFAAGVVSVKYLLLRSLGLRTESDCSFGFMQY